MNLIITASTDKGLEREKNQDSLLAKQYRIEGHHVVAAIISDGMGGEVKGEIASSSVVKSFERWIANFQFLSGKTRPEIDCGSVGKDGWTTSMGN